jgi:hypothetical protein
MGRAPCCEKEGLRRGAWSAEEDQRLVAYVRQNGHPNWRALPRQAGLLRCGKSCRLRWINYLRPDIKRGNFTPDEEALIVRLHRELGNRSVRQHSAPAVIPFRLLLLLAQIFRSLFFSFFSCHFYRRTGKKINVAWKSTAFLCRRRKQRRLFVFFSPRCGT